MSLLHKESYECVVSDLDLTATPPTQTSVEEATVVEHIPIYTLTHGGPIEFLSLGSSVHYRDLSDMHIGLKCRVRKNRNDNLDESCSVALINYLINTLFAQVDIFLGGKKITPSIATHAWRAIIEVLISGKKPKTHTCRRLDFLKIPRVKWTALMTVIKDLYRGEYRIPNRLNFMEKYIQIYAFKIVTLSIM